jgi:hypothetical protein
MVSPRCLANHAIAEVQAPKNNNHRRERRASSRALIVSYSLMKLNGLSTRVKNLLLITKNYTVFDIQDDEAAAVSSFK